MVDINDEIMHGMMNAMKSVSERAAPVLEEHLRTMSEVQKELLLLMINTLQSAREGKIKLPESGEAALTELIKSGAPMKQISVNQRDYDEFKKCLEESKLVYASFAAGESRIIYFSAKDTDKAENAVRLFEKSVKPSRAEKTEPKDLEKPSLDEVIKTASKNAEEKNNSGSNKKREAELGGE